VRNFKPPEVGKNKPPLTTSTSTGLKVFSNIKSKVYERGRKVNEIFKQNMKIRFDQNLGKWNYRAIPQR
jgi:hypothetical protein